MSGASQGRAHTAKPAGTPQILGARARKPPPKPIERCAPPSRRGKQERARARVSLLPNETVQALRAASVVGSSFGLIDAVDPGRRRPARASTTAPGTYMHHAIPAVG